jgi:DNA-binding MarR family transcriptional regulator
MTLPSSERGEVPLERVVHIAEFRRSLRVFLRRTEDVARRWDLTPQRFLLLLVIKGAPDRSERLNITEIAERLQLSRNSVTELCDRAVEAGLVIREPCSDDQRVVNLRLTREGERRLHGVLLESEAHRDELQRGFRELIASFGAASAN